MNLNNYRIHILFSIKTFDYTLKYEKIVKIICLISILVLYSHKKQIKF